MQPDVFSWKLDLTFLAFFLAFNKIFYIFYPSFTMLNISLISTSSTSRNAGGTQVLSLENIAIHCFANLALTSFLLFISNAQNVNIL